MGQKHPEIFFVYYQNCLKQFAITILVTAVIHNSRQLCSSMIVTDRYEVEQSVKTLVCSKAEKMRDDHLFVLSSEFFVSFTLGQVIEEEIINFVMTIIILLFIPVIKVVFIPSDELRAPASKRKRSNASAPLSCSLPAIARCLNLLLVIIKFLRSSSAMLATFTFW